MSQIRLWNPFAAAAVATVAAAGALFAAALAYAYFVEPRRLQMERLTVRLANGHGRLPAEGLRILHLSDSHFRNASRRERPKIDQIRRLTQGLEFDLLLHTGDLIHDDSGMDTTFELLHSLPEPRLGRFVVLGNHDYSRFQMSTAVPRMFATWKEHERSRGKQPWTLPLRLPDFVRYVRNTPLDGKRCGHNNDAELTRRLQEAGYTVMHNRHVRLVDPAAGLDIYLAGIDDVGEGRPHLGSTLAGIPEDAPLLLMSHNPDILASPQLKRVDLLISGHTHGGQIVLPVWGPAHTQSRELTRKEVSGFFRRGRTFVYVTRGIGEGIPLRFGAPPQIALITVLAGEAGA